MNEPRKIFYKKESIMCIYSLSSISPGDQIAKDTIVEYGRDILKPSKPLNSSYSSKIIKKKYKQKPELPEKVKKPLDPTHNVSCDDTFDVDHHSHTESCILIGRRFVSLEEKLEINPKLKFSQSRNISQLFTFSFLVLNLGKHRAVVSLQISPDNKRWLNDSSEVSIEPSDIVAITANNFANYTRLALRATRCDAEIKIWFQGQT